MSSLKKTTKKRTGHMAKGIKLTAGEFKALVNYLTRNSVQSITKRDVSDFLEAYHMDKDFRRAYKS